MKNLASVHSGNKTVINYIVDSDCTNNCGMCYVNNMEYSERIIKKSDSQINNELIDLKKLDYPIFVIAKEILNHVNYKKILHLTEQKHVLTAGDPIVNNPSMLEELVDIGIEQIVLSLNLQEVEGILNLPDYETVLESTKLVKEADLSVMYTMIVNSKNYDKCEEMADFVNKIGGETLRFLAYVPFGKSDLSLTKEQMKIFMGESYKIQKLEKFENLQFSRGGTLSGPYHEKGNVCTAGTKRFVIGLDNNIYPCIYLVKPEYKIGSFENGKLNIDVSKVKDPKLNPFCTALKYLNKIDFNENINLEKRF